MEREVVIHMLTLILKLASFSHTGKLEWLPDTQDGPKKSRESNAHLSTDVGWRGLRSHHPREERVERLSLPEMASPHFQIPLNHGCL